MISKIFIPIINDFATIISDNKLYNKLQIMMFNLF